MQTEFNERSGFENQSIGLSVIPSFGQRAQRRVLQGVLHTLLPPPGNRGTAIEGEPLETFPAVW